MTITLEKLDLADFQLKQLARVEKAGDFLGSKFTNMLIRAAKLARKKRQQIQIKEECKLKLIGEMAKVATMSYVQEVDRMKKQQGLVLGYRQQYRKVARQLDLDLGDVRDKFATLTGRPLRRSISALEDRLNGAVRSVIKQGLSERKSAQLLAIKLERMGLTIKKPGVIKTWIRTGASIAANAARWQVSQTDDGVWGYTYVTMRDDKVRPEHAAMDGYTRKKDDPVWLDIWPPNGWNCRCQVVVLTEPERQSRIKRNIVDNVDDGFDFNSGEEFLGPVTYVQPFELSVAMPSVVSQIALTLEDSCGAGSPGGGGFQVGNTCGSKGNEPFEGKGFKKSSIDVSEEKAKSAELVGKIKAAKEEAGKVADRQYGDYEQWFAEHAHLDDEERDVAWKESQEREDNRIELNEVWRRVGELEKEKEELDNRALLGPIAHIPSKDDYSNRDSFLDGNSYEEALEKWGQEEVDRRYNEIRDRETKWKRAMNYSLSMGDITQEQAEAKGWYDTSGAKYSEMPKNLFHVTTAADEVMDVGLKTRDELSMGQGLGLGGGTDNTISYTDSPKVAAGIQHAMLEAHRVATGEKGVDDLLDLADKGGYKKDFIRFWDSKWEEGDDLPQGLKDVRDGTKHEYSILKGIYKPEEITQEDARYARFEAFKRFSGVRERKTGELDPLFFSTDVESFARIDPSQIRIARVKAKPGAVGYQVSALGEWRSHTGDNVEVTGLTDTVARHGLMLSLVQLIGLRLADSCGAGSPGGQGFRKSNTCQRGASSKGDATKPAELKKQEEERLKKAAEYAARKYKRVEELLGKTTALKFDESEEGVVLSLIHNTGLRPGSRRDTGAKKQAYGAVTLQGRHVHETPDGVVLKFVGKKGVDLEIPVKSKAMQDMLLARKKKAGSKGDLFHTTGRKLRRHSKQKQGYLPKDFRTAVGTGLAKELVGKGKKPKSQAEFKKRVSEIAKKVSKKLGNTPGVALQSYIDPRVFLPWKPAK